MYLQIIDPATHKCRANLPGLHISEKIGGPEGVFLLTAEVGRQAKAYDQTGKE
jgi:hypothetical protein